MDIPAYFERLLRLARKGGGPVVIANSGSEEPLVVLTLSAYEKLTERQVAPEELGTEISTSYEEEEFDPQVVEQQVEDASPVRAMRQPVSPALARPRRPLGGMREMGESKEEMRQKAQEIPQNRRPIMRRPVERAEGGEERFYLESV